MGKKYCMIYWTVRYTHYFKYKGQIRDKKPHGKGTAIFGDGTTYKCNWNDGYADREGVLTLPNGQQHICTSTININYLPIIFTLTDGTIYEVTSKETQNGKFQVEPISWNINSPTGDCTITFHGVDPNVCSYHGRFEDGKLIALWTNKGKLLQLNNDYDEMFDDTDTGNNA